jgi:hypothetical protein
LYDGYSLYEPSESCAVYYGSGRRVNGSPFSSRAYYINTRRTPVGVGIGGVTQLAGIESALRSYEAFLAQGAERFPLLDELIEKRQAGTLKVWVSEQTAKCLTY